MMEREGGAASVLACSEKSSSWLYVSLKHVLSGSLCRTERISWQLHTSCTIFISRPKRLYRKSGFLW